MNSGRVRFGLFEFDLDRHELRREGALVHLAAQPAQALALLIAHSGKVVTREELRGVIWGGETYVDFDRGLNFCISQIRSALNDDSTTPRYIRTLPKRGYQLIAPIERLSEPSEAGIAALSSWSGTLRWTRAAQTAAWASVATLLILGSLDLWWHDTRRIAKRSPVVAVFRFDNETDDPALTRFSNGLTDNVIEELTSRSGGRYVVIGNARILRLPRDQRDLTAASSSLAAEYAVLGQVETSGSETRILAHLIRLPDQTHLWVFRGDYSLTDPLGVEGQAANRIASEFGERVTSDSNGKRLPPLPNH